MSYQLSWSHYLEILKCSDELEIGFFFAGRYHILRQLGQGGMNGIGFEMV